MFLCKSCYYQIKNLINRNFALADKIRDDLKGRGIELLDTPQGVRWKKVD